jgi:hypothetical protein
MLSHIICRFMAGFTVRFTPQSSDLSKKNPTQSRFAATPTDFDPVWHGDHWQNLLSSPMDARHYVMEDWSVAPGLDWAPATVKAARR